MYLKNDVTGEIAIFRHPQTGWSEATQEEIDAYLLTQAKKAKNDELKAAFDNFMAAGYEYAGGIICDGWVAETTYSRKELVDVLDVYYRSLIDDNTGNAPASSPGEWEVFVPVFSLDDCAIQCMLIQNSLGAGASDRWKFYCGPDADNYRNQIDFGGQIEFDTFQPLYLAEKRRISNKNDYYCGIIALCLTVAAVEAISIDFSA